MQETFKLSFRLQAVYALLCIIWNAVVLLQLRMGVDAIGPTGSYAVIVGAVILVGLLYLCLEKQQAGLYLLVSILIGALAISAVVTGLTSRADLWPSKFWQLAGLSINALGALSPLVAVLLWLRQR